jgi:hypothetical protein
MFPYCSLQHEKLRQTTQDVVAGQTTAHLRSGAITGGQKRGQHDFKGGLGAIHARRETKCKIH